MKKNPVWRWIDWVMLGIVIIGIMWASHGIQKVVDEAQAKQRAWVEETPLQLSPGEKILKGTAKIVVRDDVMVYIVIFDEDGHEMIDFHLEAPIIDPSPAKSI